MTQHTPGREPPEQTKPMGVSCPRCGKQNPAEIHTCTPLALRLADELDRTGTVIYHHACADELRRLSAALEMNARTIAMYENEQLDDEALLRQALVAFEQLYDFERTYEQNAVVAAIQERLK